MAHPIRIRTAEGWKDIAIPGPPGAQGAPGATGAQGSPGAAGAQGIPGTPGTQGPQGLKGDPGNQGIQGIPGNPGSTGAPGAPGALWRSGAGAPAGALGIVGDWYLNDSNGDIYEKTGASTYTLRDNLTGPQGIQGNSGHSRSGWPEHWTGRWRSKRHLSESTDCKLASLLMLM